MIREPVVNTGQILNSFALVLFFFSRGLFSASFAAWV
jgi:hypothetical protein